MKAGGGKRKGGNFENKMCRALSMWFSKGECDDWFTRTASSGAKFTLRAKAKKSTANQDGDITSTCNEGLPLVNVCSLEMKNGYGGWSIMDLLDRPVRKGKTTPQTFELFFEQANGTEKHPIIIAKKDGRKEIIFFPMVMFNFLKLATTKKVPSHLIYVPRSDEAVTCKMIGMNLEDFFDWAEPAVFARLEKIRSMLCR